MKTGSAERSCLTRPSTVLTRCSIFCSPSPFYIIWAIWSLSSFVVRIKMARSPQARSREDLRSILRRRDSKKSFQTLGWAFSAWSRRKVGVEHVDQPAAGVVADVAGRNAEDARDAVRLGVKVHIA